MRTDEMVKEIDRLRSEVAYAQKKEKAYRDQIDKCYEEIRTLLCDLYSCASNYSNGENLDRQDIVDRLAVLGYEPVLTVAGGDMYELEYRGMTDLAYPETGLVGIRQDDTQDHNEHSHLAEDSEMGVLGL